MAIHKVKVIKSENIDLSEKDCVEVALDYLKRKFSFRRDEKVTTYVAYDYVCATVSGETKKLRPATILDCAVFEVITNLERDISAKNCY